MPGKKKDAAKPQEPQSISKLAAIRKMVAKGLNGPKEISEAIKKEYNLDVTTGYISTAKATMKAKKAAAKPAAPASGLNAAVAFCEGVGSVSEAKALLDTIERIKSLS